VLVRLEPDESLSALRACLSELPATSREMIRRRYFDQLSPGAIAGHLGCQSNSVRQTLLRLRRALLECVEHRLLSEGG
jgi:RNA polymerase sigma-70 factor (ECF subfamily)